MNTPFLKSYYRRKSTYLTSEQIETIRSLKDKQQIIQSTISTLVSLTSSKNFNQIRRETLYPESTTPLNTEIKKRSSKSRSKSVLCNNELCSHISDSIPTNNSTEKI
ncbi:9217_t:CDS:2, partial [Dentiscutata heterogama]